MRCAMPNTIQQKSINIQVLNSGEQFCSQKTHCIWSRQQPQKESTMHVCIFFSLPWMVLLIQWVGRGKCDSPSAPFTKSSTPSKTNSFMKVPVLWQLIILILVCFAVKWLQHSYAWLWLKMSVQCHGNPKRKILGPGDSAKYLQWVRQAASPSVVWWKKSSNFQTATFELSAWFWGNL